MAVKRLRDHVDGDHHQAIARQPVIPGRDAREALEANDEPLIAARSPVRGPSSRIARRRGAGLSHAGKHLPRVR